GRGIRAERGISRMGERKSAVPTLQRACIFVDGENFRYSLKDLCQNGRFRFGRTHFARGSTGSTYIVPARMHAQPPVLIEPYQASWPLKFEAEKALLSSVLSPWLA